MPTLTVPLIDSQPPASATRATSRLDSIDESGIAVRATKLALTPAARASLLSCSSLATDRSSTRYALTVRSPVMNSSAVPLSAPVRSWSNANAGPE